MLPLSIGLLTAGCRKEAEAPAPLPSLAIRGVDASYIPEIRQSGVSVRNAQDQAEDMLLTLKNAGVNAIRLRLWHNPADGHAGFEEVKAFSEEIKAQGMKVWLTVHYADSWADPGKQPKPAAWANISYAALLDSIYQYTRHVVAVIKPDIIQVGNEINNGLLWPEGHIDRPEQMKALVQQGILGARSAGVPTKIMLHYAGHSEAPAFFNFLGALDYDLIGLSYYPNWHGYDLDALSAQLKNMSQQFGKDLIVAETSYPFSFEWGDQTNNIIGTPSQILTEFPPTPQGQLDFLLRIRKIVAEAPKGTGICYWGGEWIAFKGRNATDGSTWENQALWNFSFKALPVLEAFAE